MSRFSGNAVITLAVFGAANLAAAAAAHAAVSRAADNACVFSSTIQDFRGLDHSKLVVWSPGRRNAYLVELSMPLTNLKFAQRLAVIDRDHNGQLCGYGMDRIVVDTGFREASTVMGVRRLDEAGIEALEQQYGVSLTRKKSPDKPDEQAAAQASPAASGSAP
jgi:Family of unknown function (DUF6491)